MQELVSIGIPTYNRPHGLKKTLEQFTSQTYTNIEIIVSDNCSENSAVNEIIQEFVSKDTRIVNFKQKENIGMFENFRFVLSKATGKYFMWASDDDEFFSEYIEKCINEFKLNPEIILASPICKVVANGEEIMHYKPDFDTVELAQLERVKKIAFYVKKSHSALYGLMKTDIIKKLKLHTILDTDGLLLIELSRFGAFKRINEVLMISNVEYNENGTESLTYQKQKMIERYKMKPAQLLLKHEYKTLFFYFTLQTLKWKGINIFKRLKASVIIYRSFFGYNTNKLFSMFRTFKFFLKEKSILPVVNFCPESVINLELIQSLSENFEKVLISLSTNNYGDYNSKTDFINNLSKKIKSTNIKNIELYTDSWTTLHAQQQQTLDYIRTKKLNYTHLYFISDLQKANQSDCSFLYTFAKNKKSFNRQVYLNHNNFIFPNRKFVNFKADNALTIGSIKI